MAAVMCALHERYASPLDRLGARAARRGSTIQQRRPAMSRSVPALLRVTTYRQ
jgi:hypothetical protein